MALNHVPLKSQVSLDLLLFIVPKEATGLANQSSKEVGTAGMACPSSLGYSAPLLPYMSFTQGLCPEVGGRLWAQRLCTEQLRGGVGVSVAAALNPSVPLCLGPPSAG